MDVKAMAKSKRSHSQHHANKSYPKPAAAKASASASAAANSLGNSKRPSGKNVVEKPSHSRPRGSELPSNSDCYLDEDELETIDGANVHHTKDVVKPKSKGADYRYLISEARSQTHSSDYMDVYSSLDDILSPDLSQGFGDLLSVRGEAILSWFADDYFIVEDKAKLSNEVSFLSLNLNTLNEQLAKVDLAQRLFIEPDALPPELRSQKCELKDDGKKPLQKSAQNKVSETDNAMTKDEIVLKEVTVTSSEVGDNDGHPDEACLSRLKLKSQVKGYILPDSNKRVLPEFEVSQAEAELDMLLGSLGGTNLPISSSTADQRTGNVSGLDDALDVLLSLNSGMVKTAYSQEDPTDNLLSSNSKMTNPASILDDGIDDLLGATSYMTIQGNNTYKSGNAAATLAPKNSGSSSKAAKVVDEDDFDSWLETLS